jgi:hypothetical protein
VSGDSGTIEAGRAAWTRLRDRDRATWTDWLDVARALAIGRTEALKAAGTNSPVGTRYNTAMGAWLRENGLGDVVAQERYRLFLILQNLDAVETWRAGLDEAKRRRLNHPNAIWAHWRRATKVETSVPTHRHVVKGAKVRGSGHAIHWPGDAIRRAASAIREVYSTDFYVMARRALEAAIRNESDLIELLPPNTVAMSALPRRTDVVSPAGYVG